MRAMTEDPEDPFQEWSRPIPGQPEALMQGYASEELRDNAIRSFTARHHENEINLWLAALNLYAFAFEPHRVYSAGGPEPESPEDTEETQNQRRAYALRLQLLALAGRAIKLALDATLSGYYTEAWTLLRTMLDGWARCVYVRVRPGEYVRWYAPEEEDSESAGTEADKKPRQGPPHWGEIEGVIRKDGDDTDRALLEEALLRWELMQMGSHPSGEGIEQIRNDALGIMMYRPEYHEGFCMSAFSLGVFIQRVLLREVEFLASHEELWLKTNAKLATDVRSLENSIRPALDEVAARIQARRAARRE
jgi:hypothetical protein